MNEYDLPKKTENLSNIFLFTTVYLNMPILKVFLMMNYLVSKGQAIQIIQAIK